MKLTKGKKIALTCFAAFLGFMAICTVVARGIYASGLPRVSTAKPYSGSLTHVIKVNGTVMQGQEYGVYVEPGLRVDTISVGKGDTFREEAPLFRIAPEDLADIIAQRRLEVSKLEVQLSEERKEESRERKARQQAAERAREDYDREIVLADAKIQECRQAYEAAQKALVLYNQYLENASRPAESGDVSNGDAGGETEPSEPGETADPEEQYNKEEKRQQLEQNVIAAAQALADAERQKEDRLQTAARVAEDADAAIEVANTAMNTMALEIAYQKEMLQGLEELLNADGWVYAQDPGYVTDSRLEVGERTQDRACLLYALDDGERIISAVFDEEQAKQISTETRFDMKATMPDGSRIIGKALVDYAEKGENGRIYARLSFDQPEISIGQSVELGCRIQTENYGTCVPVNCIYTEEVTGVFYVYIAEERQGILGTEWKVRKVFVQILDRNDTAAAIQSMELTVESRIVTGTNKPLADGDTVRIVL